MFGDVFNNGDPYELLPNSGCFSENPSPVLGKGWGGVTTSSLTMVLLMEGLSTPLSTQS